MSKHARLSLSHSDLWLGCAAWPRMVEGMGDEESPAIEFGNKSHDILEKLMVGQAVHATSATREEFDCAQVTYNYAMERWKELGGGSHCLAEAELKINSTNRGDLWGSADVVLYNTEVIEIVDHKTGEGTFVDEKLSGQLKHYAIAALETLGLVKGENQPLKVLLTISQPRHWAEPKIRTYETTPDELYTWLAMVSNPAAQATDDPNAVGTASVRCKKCAGRHVCEYRDAAVAQALTGDLMDQHAPDPLNANLKTTMEVTEDMIRDNQEVVVYDNKRLSEMLLLVPVIRDYCDAMEEHAQEIIMQGEQVDCFKVVNTGGRPEWVGNMDELLETLNKSRLKTEDYMKSKLKTPKQVAALKTGAESNKPLSKALAKTIADHTGRSSGGLALVLDTDPRDSAAPVFKAQGQPALPSGVAPVTNPAELPAFLL